MYSNEKNSVNQKIEAKNNSCIENVAQISTQNIAQQNIENQNVHVHKYVPDAFHRTPLLVPALTEEFVTPPKKEEIKRYLLNDTKSRDILAITAIQGLGGIGKSTLAKIIANDIEIQNRFSDGILWATLGKETDILFWLNSWIECLGDYPSSKTVQAASNHLRSILRYKNILLVVDDVWDSNDVKPFLVGGYNCQTLITTRKTYIADDLGAEAFSLNVMTKKQSLELFQKVLKDLWNEDEKDDALIVAKDVGYLPFALNLAAKKRKRDYSWRELHKALEKEIALLSVLESPRKVRKGEESLEASLNLSLKDLKSYDKEAWINFVWLGVLPEDTKINEIMATTLWNLNQKKTKEILELLWEEGLLTHDSENEFEKLKTYRIHDLFHDITRYYLTLSYDENRDDSGLGLKIKDAHNSLLNRYQAQIEKTGLWHTLKNDTYIHSHLTWHMEKAERIEDIHMLLREENENGRNGWYEVLESQGQSSVFIKDIQRAWTLSEKDSEYNIKKGNIVSSIGLEIRYALIYTSINSLSANIPEELLIALLETKKWTAAKALFYALKEPNLFKKTSKLISIYTRVNEQTLKKEQLLKNVLDSALKIKNIEGKSQALLSISLILNGQKKNEILGNALTSAYNTRTHYEKACALSNIAPNLSGQKKEKAIRTALNSAYKVKTDYKSSLALSVVALNLEEREKEKVINKALSIAYNIKTFDKRALALSAIAPNLSEQNKEKVLGNSLEAAFKIKNNYKKSLVLSNIIPNLAGQKKENVIKKAFRAAMKCRENYQKSKAISLLVLYLHGEQKEKAIKKALGASIRIEDADARVKALSTIVPYLTNYKKEKVIKSTRYFASKIKDDYKRAEILLEIIPNFSENNKKRMLQQILETLQKIKDENKRAEIIINVASNISNNNKDIMLPQILETLPTIKNDAKKAEILLNVATNYEGINKEKILVESLKLTQKNENKELRLQSILAAFPYLEGQNKDKLLLEALNITSKFKLRIVKPQEFLTVLSNLNDLEKDKILLQMLDKAQTNEDYLVKTRRLLEIIPYLDKQKMEAIEKAVESAYNIQDNYQKSQAFTALAYYLDGRNKEFALIDALNAAYQIKDVEGKVKALSAIIPHLDEQKKENVLKKILNLACGIKDDYKRSRAFSVVLPYSKGKIEEQILIKAFDSASLIKDTHTRIEAFFAIATSLNEQKKEEMLKIVLPSALYFKDETYRHKAVNIVLVCLKDIPMKKRYFWWRQIIQKLRERTRNNLLMGIAAFIPIIDDLGNEEALYETFKAINDVSRWWP